MEIITLNVVPVAKPRMTKRDVWKKRPCVVKYREYCDQLRAEFEDRKLPEHGLHIIFVVPMPKSWSKKSRALHIDSPHKQRPDLDNFAKAFFDALLPEDSRVWHCQLTKRWGGAGKILIATGLAHHGLELRRGC